MALTEAQKRKIEEEERYKADLQATMSTALQQNQRYGLPAFLSFIIPGLGQIVKGQVGKGILIFFGCILGWFVFVIPGLIIWIWNIVDAYNN